MVSKHNKLEDFIYSPSVDLENYFDINDLTNKRESFLSELKAFHSITSIENVFDLVEYIDSVVKDVKSLNTENKEILQLLKIYERILRPTAVKINKGLIKKTTCHNDIFFNKVYHNIYGSVKLFDLQLLGLNDYAWDYACLISRSHDNKTYVAILNNNKLIKDASIKYKDDYLQTRTIMCMALVDLVDIFKLYLSLNREDVEKYSMLFSSDSHTIDILKERLISFVSQSYTTIDYFNYIYK